MKFVKIVGLLTMTLASGVALAQKAGSTLDVSVVDFKGIDKPFIQKLDNNYYSYLDGSDHKLATTRNITKDGKILRRSAAVNVGSGIDPDGGLAACRKEILKSAAVFAKQYKYSFKVSRPLVSFNSSIPAQNDDFYYFSDSPLTEKDLFEKDGGVAANVPFAELNCVLNDFGSLLNFNDRVPNLNYSYIHDVEKRYRDNNKTPDESRDMVKMWRGFVMGEPIDNYKDKAKNTYKRGEGSEAIWQTKDSNEQKTLEILAREFIYNPQAGRHVGGTIFTIRNLTANQCASVAVEGIHEFQKLVGDNSAINFSAVGDKQKDMFYYVTNSKEVGLRNYFRVSCVGTENGIDYVEKVVQYTKKNVSK